MPNKLTLMTGIKFDIESLATVKKNYYLVLNYTTKFPLFLTITFCNVKLIGINGQLT